MARAQTPRVLPVLNAASIPMTLLIVALVVRVVFQRSVVVAAWAIHASMAMSSRWKWRLMAHAMIVRALLGWSAASIPMTPWSAAQAVRAVFRTSVADAVSATHASVELKCHCKRRPTARAPTLHALPVWNAVSIPMALLIAVQGVRAVFQRSGAGAVSATRASVKLKCHCKMRPMAHAVIRHALQVWSAASTPMTPLSVAQVVRVAFQRWVVVAAWGIYASTARSLHDPYHPSMRCSCPLS